MVNLSRSHYEARPNAFGLVRHLIHSVASAFAERRASKQREETLAAAQLVEPGLFGEDGFAPGRKSSWSEDLSRMNPAVLAAGVFCQPRR